LEELFGVYPRLRWLAGLVVMLLLGIGALVWHQLQPPAASTQIGAVVASAPVQATGAPTAVTQPGSVVTPSAGPGTAVSPATGPPAVSPPTLSPLPVAYPETEVAAAREVATKFLVALESYRYDDPPDATRKAVRPYASDKLDQELSKSSSGAAGNAKRAALHEVTTATVVQLSCEGCAGGAPLGFIGQVKQHIHSDVGDRDETLPIETIMAKTPAGWRVAEVDF